jgi:hypothetical protein
LRFFGKKVNYKKYTLENSVHFLLAVNIWTSVDEKLGEHTGYKCNFCLSVKFRWMSTNSAMWMYCPYFWLGY